MKIKNHQIKLREDATLLLLLPLRNLKTREIQAS
uniref:Uncharacterized protein n=1 Tax=Arundo donax TaxID=35708 RepID=A0A0A9EJQ5_ARUDO